MKLKEVLHIVKSLKNQLEKIVIIARVMNTFYGLYLLPSSCSGAGIYYMLSRCASAISENHPIVTKCT